MTGTFTPRGTDYNERKGKQCEEFPSFAKRFEHMAKFYEIPKANWAHMFATCLATNAHDEYLAMSKEQQDDFSQTVEHLSKIYPAPMRNEWTYRIQWDALRQAQDEPLRDFVARIESLAHKAHTSLNSHGLENEKIMKFRYGLASSYLRYDLAAVMAETLQELGSRAIAIQMSRDADPATMWAGTTEASEVARDLGTTPISIARTARFEPQQHPMGEATRLPYAYPHIMPPATTCATYIPTSSFAVPATPPPPTPSYNPPTQPPPAHPQGSEQRRQQPKDEGYPKKRPGDYQRGMDLASIRCYNCGEPGHLANKCSRPDKRLQRSCHGGNRGRGSRGGNRANSHTGNRQSSDVHTPPVSTSEPQNVPPTEQPSATQDPIRRQYRAQGVLTNADLDLSTDDVGFDLLMSSDSRCAMIRSAGTDLTLPRSKPPVRHTQALTTEEETEQSEKLSTKQEKAAPPATAREVPKPCSAPAAHGFNPSLTGMSTNQGRIPTVEGVEVIEVSSDPRDSNNKPTPLFQRPKPVPLFQTVSARRRLAGRRLAQQQAYDGPVQPLKLTIPDSVATVPLECTPEPPRSSSDLLSELDPFVTDGQTNGQRRWTSSLQVNPNVKAGNSSPEWDDRTSIGIAPPHDDSAVAEAVKAAPSPPAIVLPEAPTIGRAAVGVTEPSVSPESAPRSKTPTDSQFSSTDVTLVDSSNGEVESSNNLRDYCPDSDPEESRRQSIPVTPHGTPAPAEFVTARVDSVESYVTSPSQDGVRNGKVVFYACVVAALMKRGPPAPNFSAPSVETSVSSGIVEPVVAANVVLPLDGMSSASTEQSSPNFALAQTSDDEGVKMLPSTVLAQFVDKHSVAVSQVRPHGTKATDAELEGSTFRSVNGAGTSHAPMPRGTGHTVSTDGLAETIPSESDAPLPQQTGALLRPGATPVCLPNVGQVGTAGHQTEATLSDDSDFSEPEEGSEDPALTQVDELSERFAEHAEVPKVNPGTLMLQPPACGSVTGTPTLEDRPGPSSQQQQPRSLIASTHEYVKGTAATPNLRSRLTESGLQLGKEPPIWIPDKNSSVCMLCESKFTIVRRRHHCRACGRVLCADCCNQKAKLSYMSFKEARVCSPCSERLRTIDEYEAAQLEQRQSDAGTASAEQYLPAVKPEELPAGVVVSPPGLTNPKEYCSQVPLEQQTEELRQKPSTPPVVMVPVSVLKRSANPTAREAIGGPMDLPPDALIAASQLQSASGPSVVTRKQVMFSDGIKPGGDLRESVGPSVHVPSPTMYPTQPGGTDASRLALQPKRRRALPETGGGELQKLACLLDEYGVGALHENPESNSHTVPVIEQLSDPKTRVDIERERDDFSSKIDGTRSKLEQAETDIAEWQAYEREKEIEQQKAIDDREDHDTLRVESTKPDPTLDHLCDQLAKGPSMTECDQQIAVVKTELQKIEQQNKATEGQVKQVKVEMTAVEERRGQARIIRYCDDGGRSLEKVTKALDGRVTVCQELLENLEPIFGSTITHSTDRYSANFVPELHRILTMQVAEAGKQLAAAKCSSRENGSAQAPPSVPPAQNTGHRYSVQSLPSVPPTPSSVIPTPRYHYSPSPRYVVESGSPWTAPAQGGYGTCRPPAQPQGQPIYEQHSMPSQGSRVKGRSHRSRSRDRAERFKPLRSKERSGRSSKKEAQQEALAKKATEPAIPSETAIVTKERSEADVPESDTHAIPQQTQSECPPAPSASCVVGQ